MSNIGIHIFRKDHRINDNLALADLYKKVDKIILIFILDPYQVDEKTHNNHYRSDNSVQFMCESLDDLNDQCDGKLLIFYGDPDKVVNYILKTINVTHLSYNADYTKYSLLRDKKINDVCKDYEIDIIINYDDQCLTSMEDLIKEDGTPYMVFGSFFKNEMKCEIFKPKKVKNDKFYKPTTLTKYKYNFSDLKNLYDFNSSVPQEGGRKFALKRMKDKDAPKNYENRDSTLYSTTFNISAGLNFGCISVREFYHYHIRNKSVVKQMCWRDFFLCILRFHPNGNSYSKFLDERYNQIKWKKNYKDWKAMIDCKTGFLLIDASMMELKTTGFISNRARLLLGSFWIKMLLINPFDPKWGLQAGFSKYLVDCSCSQNKMNTSWLLSELDLPGRRFKQRGCHALTGRRIRIDNEMIKQYDPKGEYIKHFLPHLKDKTVKELINHETIFDWKDRYDEYCDLFDNIK